MVACKMDLLCGRSAMWQIEADLLSEVCRIDGDHIEVGTLWGASAIIAARAKPRPYRIYSIDIMSGGYWKEGDPGCDMKRPTARAILANFAGAGVADRITLICGSSFPLPIKNIAPSTVLIDAGHNAADVLQDWLTFSRITTRYIALHDYGEKHPDLAAVIDDMVLKDPRWRKYEIRNSLLVMERR